LGCKYTYGASKYMAAVKQAVKRVSGCLKNEGGKRMGSYIYLLTDVCDGFRTYTVGHYDPAGKFQPESDHSSKEEAAARVHYLNGGTEGEKGVK
jgi:hypothetical protein